MSAPDETTSRKIGIADTSSHRRILWATSVVGGATLGALIIGLARNKAVALIGGPSAIGLLGLFTSIMAMGSSAALFGLNTSTVQRLSQFSGDPQESARIRRAIWTLVWPLALAGGAAIWFSKGFLASWSAGSSTYANAVGWLSIGVIGAVLGETQLAVLQAYGRLGDLARVRLWGSLAATVIGIVAVMQLGVAGIVVAVVATPVLSALFAIWFGWNLPPSQWRLATHEPLADLWGALARVGAIVMLTSALASFTQFAVRALVTQRLGLSSAGFYQAASSIMWVNLSLVLNAMSADFFPRIAKTENPAAMSDVLNSQLHVTLILAAPALAATCVAAPIALTLLYSSTFADSAVLLRLLTVAAVLRMPIWAFGYVLLARRSSALYFFGEVSALAIIPLTWLFLPQVGLLGAGIAAIASAILSFFVYRWQVGRAHDVHLNPGNLRTIFLLIVFLCGITALFETNQTIGIIVGALGTAWLCWNTFGYLRSTLSN